MPGPRPLQIAEAFKLVIFVNNLQRDRAAERLALPNAGENIDRIGLYALASATAVATLAATKFLIDDRGIELYSGGKSIDERQQRLAMRFARSPIA